MLFKSATGMAFATACLTALATAPGAMAQTANPSGTSTYQTQTQQSPQSTTDWSRGGYGSTSGNYTPQADQGNASSSWAGGDQLVTNGPQSSGVERSGNWSARRNVIQSRHYTRLLETNTAFRHARMRKECGPITDPQLHENCVASFDRYAPPMYGSSTAPHPYGSSYGR
ncbi:MAG TPA: hypothetical protein VGM07_09840 [Stellaceae bacterium]